MMIDMQISELKQRLDLLNSACDEVYNKLLLVFGAVHIFLRHILLLLVDQVRSSQKLKEIMKRIDYLGKKNQGPARGKTIAMRSPGVTVGFKLKNLLNVGHTRGASSMQHLCKVNYNRNKDLERNDLAQELYLIPETISLLYRTLLPGNQI